MASHPLDKVIRMTQFKLLPLYAALLLGTACSQPGVKTSQPEAVATQQAAEDAAAEEAAKVAKAKGPVRGTMKLVKSPTVAKPKAKAPRR